MSTQRAAVFKINVGTLGLHFIGLLIELWFQLFHWWLGLVTLSKLSDTLLDLLCILLLVFAIKFSGFVVQRGNWIGVGEQLRQKNLPTLTAVPRRCSLTRTLESMFD